MANKSKLNILSSKHLILISLLILLVMGAFTGLKFARSFRDNTVARFEKVQASQNENTIFYDINNKPFHIIRGLEDRKYIPLSGISRNLQLSVVAIEDARFFRHWGFDFIRIIKAVSKLFIPNTSLHGASTITQQLVKLSLLSPERTLKRKVKELMMAIALETKYSKAQILEFYLNKVYLGHRNYGVENAALNYFKKNARDLNLAEGAFIAGLIKKPEGYSPFTNLNGSRKRQVLVLRQLYKLKWITLKQYNEAVNYKIVIRRKRQSDLRKAPYFTNHIILKLKEKYGADAVYGGGLRVYTTLEQNMQQQMEQVVQSRAAKRRSFDAIAGISIDPQNGFVKALVGGIDFNKSEFNRATQALRQAGSSFKPILYSTALNYGLKPNDVFLDEPLHYENEVDGEIQVYEPGNYGDKHYGMMTMGQALRTSNNVISVKILEKLGTRRLVKQARKFGLSVKRDYGLCLALGCSETTLIKMVTAYGVFANNGKINQPVFILKVTNSQGKLLEKFSPGEEKIVLSENQTYLMNRMLQDVVEFGTGRNARINQVSGGKTGTSDNFRDAWYIGYTPNLVTGFWVGNDDNTPTRREVGGGTPARLWKAYMRGIDQSIFTKNFPVNEQYADQLICAETGQLASPYCQHTAWYPFHEGAEPQKICEKHSTLDIELKICRESGELATSKCPISSIENRAYNSENAPKKFCHIHGTHLIEEATSDGLLSEIDESSKFSPETVNSEF